MPSVFVMRRAATAVPVFVTAGTSQSTSSGTPSITLVGIQAGDTLVWLTGQDSDGPSGFTKQQDYQDTSGNNNHLEVWTKTADGTETTISGTAHPWYIAICYVFRGGTLETTALSAFTAGATSKATPTATATGTPIVLHVWKTRINFSGVGLTPPGGLSDVRNITIFSTLRLAAGWEAISAGTSPSRTATSLNSQDWISAAVVIG